MTITKEQVEAWRKELLSDPMTIPSDDDRGKVNILCDLALSALAARGGEPKAYLVTRARQVEVLRPVYPILPHEVAKQKRRHPHDKVEPLYTHPKAEVQPRLLEKLRKELKWLPNQVSQSICEIPDRNSPEDQPEMCLVTVPEIVAAVKNACEPIEILLAAPQGDNNG